MNPAFLKRLGPGLITGASDDDPSGIATYSQVGAQWGYGILWTMPFSYPLMVGIQEISAEMEKDRRVILLSLTRRGEAATSTIEKKIEAIMLRFFESVPKADRAASLRVFKKLAQYLKEQLNAPKKK